jgi:hypothetical protein
MHAISGRILAQTTIEHLSLHPSHVGGSHLRFANGLR